MSRYISNQLRTFVAKRAEFRCEYCLIFERYSFLPFHIEHIISLKHSGSSDAENLAFACPICNYSKGPDVATFIKSTSEPIRFFNPREDNWETHFKINSNGVIDSKTKIGEATLKILDINHVESVTERQTLIEKKLF